MRARPLCKKRSMGREKKNNGKIKMTNLEILIWRSLRYKASPVEILRVL